MAKTIKLGLVWGKHEYLVKTITNSTTYKPGDWLSTEIVSKLCTLPDWEISIADDDTWKAVLGVLSSHIADIPFPGLP